MSIKIAYRDGVFEPLETVEGAQPGAIYTAFSEDELRDFLETLGWLVSFPFTDLTSSKRRPALASFRESAGIMSLPVAESLVLPVSGRI